MAEVTLPKDFQKRMRDLQRTGRKVQYDKLCRAFAEAQISGKIASVPLTHHGEDRLPDVEKYDLGDGYRLVVQLVSGATGHRVFLFVGSHADADSWLETHKKYRYILRDSDKTLHLVPVSEDQKPPILPMPPETVTDLELESPIFTRITEQLWKTLAVSDSDRQSLATLTPADTLEGALDRIYNSSTLTGAQIDLFHDLTVLAIENDWDGFDARLKMVVGGAKPVKEKVLSDALAATPVTEDFVTFDDGGSVNEIIELISKPDYRDWMLYLHPEQYRWVTAEFQGPARIRGVSGSGKTSIAVHRARLLAKRYNWQIAVVTYNISLKELFKDMLDALCGAERGAVVEFTMHEFARNVLDLYAKDKLRAITPCRGDALERLTQEGLKAASILFTQAESLKSLAQSETGQSFLMDEISYIRNRFPRSGRTRYLEDARRGRRIGLTEQQRLVMLECVQEFESILRQHHVQDYEGYVLEALEAVELQQVNWLEHQVYMPRCIVADEVQDFSQNELRLLRALVPVEQPDSLFLVGDGAQKIYKRGFSLRDAGIDVSGRAKVLVKNYRNTKQIVEAAYALIRGYSFDDLDSETVDAATMPDLPTRQGERPYLIKFPDELEEVGWIAGDVQQLLQDGSVNPGEVLIIAGRRSTREAVKAALKSLGILSADLRDDVALDSTSVKISTIESAKGHETPYVYIAALVEGVLPPRGEADSESEKLHASRLYVAMTRARDRLVMSWSSESDGYRNLPSPYLRKIASACEERQLKNGQLVQVLGIPEPLAEQNR